MFYEPKVQYAIVYYVTKRLNGSLISFEKGFCLRFIRLKKNEKNLQSFGKGNGGDAKKS